MGESLLLASMAVSGGFADQAVAMTSSHFASSERQYRYPLGYGGQRSPTAQWTVTGSGAALVCSKGDGPFVEAATVGTIVDLGITDANNMGAAMAPSAFETIRSHFDDLGAAPEDFDLIVTGDLGKGGQGILLDQFHQVGVNLEDRYTDCGVLVFDLEDRTSTPVGPGCGCSAIVLCGYLLDPAPPGQAPPAPVLGTGALLSPTSSQQGESIPGVCRRIHLYRKEVSNMEYLQAFLVGGILCLIGQILVDKTSLTPARILVSYVVAGVVLGALGIYEPIVQLAVRELRFPSPALATTLAKGVRKAVTEEGFGDFHRGTQGSCRRHLCGHCGCLCSRFDFPSKDKS